MKSKHLIVVSVDALVFEDLEYAKTLPMFGRILREGSVVERVKTIYPSLTHPVHASLLTGCPAGVTGIVSNTHFTPGNLESPWYNRLEEIRCETIFHAAKRAGLSTASCRWPVTANGGDCIDYLVPEVLPADMAGHEDNPIQAYINTGTSECLLDIVTEALKRYGHGNDHPAYDEFQIYCAAEIFRRFRPNLLFTHPGYVDHMRHCTGLFNERVNASVKETDRWISMLWNAAAETGLENDTDIIILSDHGQLGISRTVCPNVFLRDAGYIQADEQDHLVSWDAYALSCGLSAQVYLSHPEDSALYNSVRDSLEKMAARKDWGTERVFTREEVKELYGLDGGFSFVLESDGITSYSDEWAGPALRELDTSDYRFGHATHGHMPEKGPQPTMFAMGPSVRKGVIVPQGHILDHAATFAKILGIDFPQAQGKAAEFV